MPAGTAACKTGLVEGTRRDCRSGNGRCHDPIHHGAGTAGQHEVKQAPGKKVF